MHRRWSPPAITSPPGRVVLEVLATVPLLRRPRFLARRQTSPGTKSAADALERSFVRAARGGRKANACRTNRSWASFCAASALDTFAGPPAPPACDFLR